MSFSINTSDFVKTPSSGIYDTTDTTKLVYTALTRASHQWASIDKGAAFFSGTAYFESSFVISAASGASPMSASIGFSDADADSIVGPNWCGMYHRLDNATTHTLTDYAALMESAVFTGVSGATLTTTLNTRYYTRSGFFSSLSRYGTVITQIFSDAARTTLVQTIVKDRAAAIDYRFFIAGSSWYTGAAMTISGEEADIVIYQPAAGIDLTTAAGWAQTDPNGRLQEYANTLRITSSNSDINSVATYHWYDLSAQPKSGNYHYSFAFMIRSMASYVATQRPGAFAVLCNTLSQLTTTTNKQAVAINWISNTTFRLQAFESATGSNAASSESSTLSVLTPYYADISRDMAVGTYGTYYLKIYSDPARQIPVGTTLTLTLRASTSFTKLALWNWCDLAANRTLTLDVGQLEEFASDISGTAAETATTGDSASATIAFAKSVAETAATGDAASLTSGFALSAAEAAQTGDSAVGGLAGSTDCQETAVTSDSASASVIDTGQKDVSATEAAATGDAASVVVGAAIFYRIYWRPIKYDAATAKDIPATGLIPKPQFKLLNADDGTTRDFGDPATLFKDAAACVDYTDAFLEMDATHWPGAHFYPLRTDILPDGRFVGAGEAPDAPGYYTDLEEIFVRDGVVVDIKSGTAGLSLTAAEVIAALGAHEYEPGFPHDGVMRGLIAAFMANGTLPDAAGIYTINSPSGKLRFTITKDLAGIRTINFIDLTP